MTSTFTAAELGLAAAEREHAEIERAIAAYRERMAGGAERTDADHRELRALLARSKRLVDRLDAALLLATEARGAA